MLKLERGKMSLHIVGANLTHDTETFGKMDPYVQIHFNPGTKPDKIQKTAVLDNAGKQP